MDRTLGHRLKVLEFGFFMVGHDKTIDGQWIVQKTIEGYIEPD